MSGWNRLGVQGGVCAGDFNRRSSSITKAPYSTGKWPGPLTGSTYNVPVTPAKHRLMNERIVGNQCAIFGGSIDKKDKAALALQVAPVRRLSGDISGIRGTEHVADEVEATIVGRQMYGIQPGLFDRSTRSLSPTPVAKERDRASDCAVDVGGVNSRKVVSFRQVVSIIVMAVIGHG